MFKKNYFLQIISMSFILFFVHLMQQSSSINFGSILVLSQIITSAICSGYVFQDDYNDGSLEQMVISGKNKLYFVFSKLFVYWFMLFLSSIINLIMLFLIFKNNPEILLSVSGVLFFSSLALAYISGFVSALTLKVSNASLVQFIIFVPLSIVFSIYAISIINQILESDISNYGVFITDFKILTAICLILIPISLYTCSHLISGI